MGVETTVDAKVLHVTFNKLQDWLKGEVNPPIECWLSSDATSYENFIWLYKECARLGWSDPNKPMLDHADDEVIMMAEQLWKAAMAFMERDNN